MIDGTFLKNNQKTLYCDFRDCKEHLYLYTLQSSFDGTFILQKVSPSHKFTFLHICAASSVHRPTYLEQMNEIYPTYQQFVVESYHDRNIIE